jgi:hypothetical protein
MQDAIFFKTRLARAAAAVKFPIVPRADDIITLDPTVTEWPSHMVAGI